MTDLMMNRRGAITSLLAISAAGALAACGPPERDVASGADNSLDFATPTQFFSLSEMAFLSALAGTIMPQTDTPGAVDAGVPGVLQELASVWGDNNYRKYWRTGIAAVNAALSASGGQEFAALSPEGRLKALKPYDADVFDGKIDSAFYRDAKSTILQAYYKSEAGASEELAYEPNPGQWIGCAPLSEYPKTWAV